MNSADKQTLLKISNTKIVNAIEYINLINSTKITNLDLSELFDGKDLTSTQKIDLFWNYEHFSNIEIIFKLLSKQIKFE